MNILQVKIDLVEYVYYSISFIFDTRILYTMFNYF